VGVDAGVVDEHVERAVAGDDGLDGALHLGLDGDVGVSEGRRDTGRRQFTGRTPAGRLVQVGKGHGRAFSGEFLDDRPADAAGAAGDKGNLSVQSSHGVCGVILYGSVAKRTALLLSLLMTAYACGGRAGPEGAVVKQGG